jgi:hypothetical protein
LPGSAALRFAERIVAELKSRLMKRAGDEAERSDEEERRS